MNYLIIFIKLILASFIFFLILTFNLKALLFFSALYFKDPLFPIAHYFQTELLTRFCSIAVNLMTFATTHVGPTT